MKTIETKTTSAARNLIQAKRQPFFSRKGQHSFFPKSRGVVTAFFGPAKIQPKFTIGQPNDEFEVEADKMADKVVQRLATTGLQNNKETAIQAKPKAPFVTRLVQTKCINCGQVDKLSKNEEGGLAHVSPLDWQRKPIFDSNAEPPGGDGNVQRKCPECEKEGEKNLQTKPESIDLKTTAPSLERSLTASKGAGSPMPENTRTQMEGSFGADFSGVRVHTDSSAVEMNKELRSQAFAHGSDIYFNAGKFNPNHTNGQRLLAHELTHTLQQSGKIKKKIQRQNTFFGPASTGVPADWSTQVSNATTSAQKTALISSSVGSAVTVIDRTTQSASDRSPSPSHLTAYTKGTPTINYDENLNSKSSPIDRRSLAPNAGYTLHSGRNFYIILGPKSLDATNYYSLIVTVNHEFDHVQQSISGSTLAGNESELDAWTSTFLREFHRTYVLGNVGGTGTNCYVQSINQFAPLQFYYEKPDVSAAQKDAAVSRIRTYYTGTISVHPAHSKVFNFWVHRMLKNSRYKDLVTRLNTDLSLGITSTDSLAITRQFPCTGITNATFPSPPSVNSPTFPAAPGSKPSRGKK